MMSLVEAAACADYPAEIGLVLSNRPDAAGLQFASDHGIATDCVDHKTFPDREAFEIALDSAIRKHDIDLVCLAGFMRLLTPWFVDRWHDRLINIHPALLPSYKGLDTHARALTDGVTLHGCTVHYVRAEMDAGPIIGQAAVPVLTDDTESSLAKRVLAQEHKLYPEALARVASGQLDQQTDLDQSCLRVLR